MASARLRCKTTFLELVLGRREPSGGTVDVSLGTTIGYFSQFSELDGEQSTWQTLSGHFTEAHETPTGCSCSTAGRACAR
ncbi:hypothetical protein [Agromyces sp. NPDC049794]|uniref:hypothetical protein n=1 Tax=unclassified Agromyces TaxID=2639701 RepID=UPI00340498F9